MPVRAIQRVEPGLQFFHTPGQQRGRRRSSSRHVPMMPPHHQRVRRLRDHRRVAEPGTAARPAPAQARASPGTAISPSRDQSSCGIVKLTILGVSARYGGRDFCAVRKCPDCTCAAPAPPSRKASTRTYSVALGLLRPKWRGTHDPARIAARPGDLTGMPDGQAGRDIPARIVRNRDPATRCCPLPSGKAPAEPGCQLGGPPPPSPARGPRDERLCPDRRS